MFKRGGSSKEAIFQLENNDSCIDPNSFKSFVQFSFSFVNRASSELEDDLRSLFLSLNSLNSLLKVDF
jgi:hypothetical protein